MFYNNLVGGGGAIITSVSDFVFVSLVQLDNEHVLQFLPVCSYPLRKVFYYALTILELYASSAQLVV